MTDMLSRYAKWRIAKTSRAISLRMKTRLVEKVPLFAGLSQRESHVIARSVREAELPAETRLVTAGEPGGELFVIIDGEAAVTTGGGRMGVVKAGDFFGEISLIDGSPRSATVNSTTPVRLLILGKDDFWRILDTQPSIVRKVMHVLCRRVRDAEHPPLEATTRAVRA